jgi:hypothetical protein
MDMEINIYVYGHEGQGLRVHLQVQHGHAAQTQKINVQDEDLAWICSMEMENSKELDILHGQWTCSMDVHR